MKVEAVAEELLALVAIVVTVVGVDVPRFAMADLKYRYQERECK